MKKALLSKTFLPKALRPGAGAGAGATEAKSAGGGGRGRATSRALRTGLVCAVLAAVTAGVVTSAPSGGAGGAGNALPAAGPSVQVDPVTGQPVPVGGSAPGGSGGSGTSATDGAGVATTDALTAVGSTDPRLPGSPTLVSPAASGSAVTVHGQGPFAGLALTVSQTSNLTDQVVKVTWTGGGPTMPNPASFATNYLELMECWGDAATGPDRTQCEYGALRGDTRGGAFVPTRQLNYGTLVDKSEPPHPHKPNENVFVPFHAVNGVVEAGQTSSFFNASTTNEVPYAATRADGTGEMYFETMTGEEAPGLGCGNTPNGIKVQPKEGRRCWLVVVPRGRTDVDGNPPTTNSGQLQSSPLSMSNWQWRMVVPLHFVPNGLNCPPTYPDQHTVGSELAEEALVRWQPVICQKVPSIVDYAALDDNLAREKLVTESDPGLVYVSDPVPPATVPSAVKITYAPMALSGVTIAFDIESQSYASAPADVRKREGQRIHNINLNARLVAKLLTQSYRYGVGYGADDVKDNQLDLTSDPEFLALNPTFKQLAFPSRIPDMLVPAGQSDVARHLWAWVWADKDARAFLQGAKDPSGMTVNPNYTAEKLNLPRDDFPKSDPYCQLFPDDPNGRPKWCVQDSHPYADNLHVSARSTSRGDTLSKSNWDATAIPPTLKKGQAQPEGEIGILAVTDTATAARYGLDTAGLLNADGQYVQPTPASMLAGAAAMKPVGGTGESLLPPDTKAKGAYPLTVVTYAATVPSGLTKEECRVFAALVGYATTTGQTPGVQVGQLNDGYVPLPQALRAQAAKAVKAILAGGPKKTGGSGGSGGAGGSSGGGGGGSDVPAVAAPATSTRPVATLAPSSPAVQDAARTARTSTGYAQYLFLVLLLVGLLAAVGGPLLTRFWRQERAD